MNFQEAVENAKKSLRQSIKLALKFLVPLINPQSDKFDDLVQVEGRYHQTESEFNRGVINYEDRELRLNQIRNSIISTINNLTEGDLKQLVDDENKVLTDSNNTMLEKLRETIAEIEKLKAENHFLKNLTKKHKLKIIIKCEPEIDNRPQNYTCNCVVLNDETGESLEKEIQLRKEPGGIIATIHDINPTDYIQIKIKDTEKMWESDYFSPQFLTQILRLV